MELFNLLKDNNYEQVTFFNDQKTNLKAIIAIHSTLLGPALGGCRMYDYATEEAALKDVLNLSLGMTFKAAAAAVNFGGGKSVIIGNPKKIKTKELLKSFARCVNGLDGKYIVSKDVGINIEDLLVFKEVTPHVTGVIVDPSVYTAYGVFKGMQAIWKFKYNTTDLKGITVAIQGIGAVGYALAKLLHDIGVKLYLTDINESWLQKVCSELKATAVPVNEIFEVECDIFAPCSLGQIINYETIDLLKTKIIAGSANNQLISDKIITLMEQKEILYIPDYIINAGGLIAVAIELEAFDEVKIYQKCDQIYNRVFQILQTAKLNNISTSEAAFVLVNQKFMLPETMMKEAEFSYV